MPLPLAVPAVLAGAQLVNQGILAYRQKKKADELRRRGPIDPTPIAFRQAQAGLQNQANNAQVAGYGQEVDNINEGVSSTIGEMKRAGISSSNLLNGLTRVNDQKRRALRDLSIRGQGEQRMRKDRAIQAEMQRGQYQELGRQENNEAIGALEGASIQNTDKLFTGGVGLLSSLTGGVPTSSEVKGGTPEQIDAVKFTTNDIPTTPDPYELGYMGGGRTAYTPLEPTPEMAGLEAPNENLLEQSVPDPYAYQPQGTNTYESPAYKMMLARKRYLGDTFRTKGY